MNGDDVRSLLDIDRRLARAARALSTALRGQQSVPEQWRIQLEGLLGDAHEAVNHWVSTAQPAVGYEDAQALGWESHQDRLAFFVQIAFGQGAGGIIGRMDPSLDASVGRIDPSLPDSLRAFEVLALVSAGVPFNRAAQATAFLTARPKPGPDIPWVGFGESIMALMGRVWDRAQLAQSPDELLSDVRLGRVMIGVSLVFNLDGALEPLLRSLGPISQAAAELWSAIELSLESTAGAK